MAAIITLIVIALGAYLVFFVFFPLARGAIYDPSSPVETRIMVEMATVARGERAADLGSGDGRVVIELAQAGAEAHGFEVNPLLVLMSRRNIRRSGLAGKARIHWGSFWRRDLSGFDIITVFQVGFVMGRLETKLQRELPTGARVISHYWRFPGLTPESTRGSIYRYRVG